MASLAFAVSLGAALVIASPASAADPHHLTGNPTAVREYWTPERMRSATAVSPEEMLGRRPPQPAKRGGSPAGRSGSRPPSAPSEAILLEGVRRIVTGEVPNQLAYPQRTNGRLFFAREGSDYRCSASVVQSQSDAVVLTAGHCLYDPESRAWSKRLVFVPAFLSGVQPFGSWVGRQQAVPPAWFQRGNFNFDYGALELNPNSRGSVGSVVGEQGLQWGYPRQQDYTSIGYPANYEDGERMWGCSSPLAGTFRSPSGGPDPSAINCPMKRGSSGGGWTFKGGAGAGPYLASVNSFFLSDEPSLLYGPYFTDGVVSVIRAADEG